MSRSIKKVSLLIFSISNAGGCERIACNIANELNRRKYKVSIINIYNSNTSFFPLDKNVEIIGLYKTATKPSKYHFPFVPLRIIQKLFRQKSRPDILIGINTDMCIYALPAIKMLQIPFISLEQYNFKADHAGNRLASWGRKVSALYAQALVVLTTKDEQLFREHLSIKGILTTIPNFTLYPETPSDMESYTAIAVGRYTYQKGFDSLIKIWEKITTRLPHWKLKIIGKGEDEPMLKNMITERHLDDNIILIPLSQNISDSYKEASVFLLSSRWEGLPLVTVEAKRFGLPIVSFDCETGPRDVIQNGIDGILVADQNIDAFADALLYLLPHREQLKSMSHAALQNSRRFTPETVMPQWEALFKKIKESDTIKHSF